MKKEQKRDFISFYKHRLKKKTLKMINIAPVFTEY